MPIKLALPCALATTSSNKAETTLRPSGQLSPARSVLIRPLMAPQGVWERLAMA